MNSGMINSMRRSDHRKIVTAEAQVTQVWVRSGELAK
jgi:hypothetical protein